jgi:hypothetical protein
LYDCFLRGFRFLSCLTKKPALEEVSIPRGLFT